MGNGYNDDDFEFEDDPQESNVMKQLRKQLKDKDKELSTLRDELGKFRTQTRTQSLAKLLEAKGVNPKAAKFYPDDLEVDEDNLAKWLKDEGDVFAPVTPPKQEEEEPAEEGTEEQQESWNQFQRIQRQEEAGTPLAPNSNTDKAQQLLSANANAKSSTEFLAWLQSGGSPTG